MTAHATLFFVLSLTACLSPLFTFLWLWQVKEWRFDRLRDHIRKEGVIRQLLGLTRPAMLFSIGCIVFFLMATSTHRVETLVLLFPLSLTVIGITQHILRKQRRPEWTKKAFLMFGVSIALSSVMIGEFALRSSDAIGDGAKWLLLVPAILVPILQPIIAMVAWMIVKPIDWTMKQRILRRTRAMRNGQPNLTVIGITGSVGKTTTKELLHHILKSKGALATPLHVNSEIGVARWLIDTLSTEPTESERILIVEMGAYRKGEIALLCSVANPTLGIITAVGTQHLALFGSVDAIVDAKGELFGSLPESGHAFGNKDNAAFDRLKEKCRCPLTSVGTDKGADLRALDIEETASGIRFTIDGTTFDVPIFGTHMVTSVLLAIAVAKHLGLQLPEIASFLRSFKGMQRTFDLKVISGITILDDTYNVSPESFRAAIDWARGQPHAKKFLLTEGIIELGSSEETVHREIARLARDVFDHAFVAHERLLPYFREYFGEQALHAPRAEKLNDGDLLVCTGRLHESLIIRLLPK